MRFDDPFERLASLRMRLGAQEGSYTFSIPVDPLRQIELRLESGIEVDRQDIKTVGPFLTYKGEALAILYIFNSNASTEALLNNEAGLGGPPKFHFTWCQTLEKMTENNRFDRYVLSRSKSNHFRVEGVDVPNGINPRYTDSERKILEDVRLYPCQHCLKEMGYKGFSNSQPRPVKLQQVEDFSIKEYLSENDGLLTVMKHLPHTLAKDAKKGGYTKDFPEISRVLREKEHWCCTKCGVDMRDKKEGLHVHHINGQKNDNREVNLKVLCALCHKNVDDYHKSMPIKPDIERYINDHR